MLCMTGSRHQAPKAEVLALLLAVLATMLLPLTVNVDAHLDPPDDPALAVNVYLRSLELLQDEDDGVDGNAELIITWLVSHEAHGSAAGVITIDDFDWDVEQSRTLDAYLYGHVECSPLNRVMLDVQVAEDDTDLATTIVAGVAGAVGGVVAGFLTTGAAIAVGAAGGGSGLVSMFAGLNGVDDLGRAALTVTSPGTYRLRGQGFVAVLEVTVATMSGSACAQPEPVPAELPEGVDRSLDERLETGQRSFAALREAVQQSSTIGFEEGNPASLSNMDVATLRSELPRRILLGEVDPRVTIAVKMAADLSGGSRLSREALGDLYAARSLASAGEHALSLDSYEAAWILSLKTIFRVEAAPASGITVSVVDEDGRPVDNVAVDVYRGDQLVLSVKPEDGKVENVTLEPGEYMVSVKTRFLSTDVGLASATFNVEEDANLTVVVSSIIVPVKWIPALGNLMISLFFGLFSGQLAGRAVAGKKAGTRRAVGLAAGLAALVLSFVILQGLL